MAKSITKSIIRSIASNIINDADDSTPAVPAPENVVARVTSYQASDERYRVTVSFDAPSDPVDSYQYRSSHNSAWVAATSGGNRAVYGTASWVEVRSVLQGRYSRPVRVNFADFTFPAIGVPRNLVVEIIEEATQLFHVELRWDPPANAFGRAIRYYADRGGTGFAYQTSGERLRYLAGRSLFPYFAVRAEADGHESGYTRVNDADYITAAPPVVTVTRTTSAEGILISVAWTDPPQGPPDNYRVHIAFHPLNDPESVEEDDSGVLAASVNTYSHSFPTNVGFVDVIVDYIQDGQNRYEVVVEEADFN